jgi:hypothetical protein
MRRATYLSLGSAALALFLTAGSASAADPKFLGYLYNQSGQIWAYPDADGRWCRENASVSVLLAPPLNYAMVERGLRTIGVKLMKECGVVASAKVAAYNADRSLAGPSFTITKDNNWLAVGAASPVAPPQSVSAPPQTQPPLPTAPAAPLAVAGEPSPQAPHDLDRLIAAPAPQPLPLPRDLNYWSALLRAVRDTPALQQDNGTLRLWALYRYEREYRQVQNQEFNLQPLLERAKVDLTETLARADTDHVTVVIDTRFGSYDFDAQRFPVSIGAQISTSRPCCVQGGPPSGFTIKLSDADAITGLPMPSEEARAFTERRTRYGNINRNISIAVSVKLDPPGFQNSGWGDSAANGAVDSVAFYADDQLNELLARVGPEEFAKWRAAKTAEQAAAAKDQAERAAEMRRQQQVAQRDQSISMLSRAAMSVKLANFISDTEVNYFEHLSNLRDARAAALISGNAVPVAMLVQADSSGRKQVATSWPGNLEVTLTDGQPEMRSSGWYLIRGLLNVPDDGKLSPAQLMAQQVYGCTQPKCAEATDPKTIVDRKLEGAH